MCQSGCLDNAAVTNSPKSPWLETIIYSYGSWVDGLTGPVCLLLGCGQIVGLTSSEGLAGLEVHNGFPPVLGAWPGMAGRVWGQLVSLCLCVASSHGLGFLTAWWFQKTKSGYRWSKTQNQTLAQCHFGCVLLSEKSQSQSGSRKGTKLSSLDGRNVSHLL